MHSLTSHIVNPANDRLKIAVEDEPGTGGACHRYVVSGFDTSENRSLFSDVSSSKMTILFQNGPIAEWGVNGVTHEVLLAILIDRLEAFQAGPYACWENRLALKNLIEATEWLKARTTGRVERGVEGTHAI